MKVRDVMTVDPVAGKEACPISMVATIMFANDCSAVPIVRSKMVVGIVTDRDIACRAVARGWSADVPAAAVMSAQLVAILPDQDIDEATHMMEENQIHHLPVIDSDGCLVGIVAQSDLGRQMSDEQFGGMSMRISIRSDHGSADLHAPVSRAASQNRVKFSYEPRPFVLLVEDDPATRTFLTVLLKRNGCDVDAVSDGVQALRKLEQNQYATVLLDLLMPRLNGFEVIQEVRALWPEMLGRIVVLTAASDITLADFPDEKRIFRLLRKPLDNAEVLSVVWSCAARLPVPAVRESQLAASH